MNEPPMTAAGALTRHLDVALRMPTCRASQLLSGRASDALVEEAVRHGLAPLLYRHVLDAPVEGERLPEAQATVRDAYLCNTLRNTAVWHDLGEVLQAFWKAGVSVIPLKGVHLAQLIYGDPGLRPIADLDLLVQEADLPRAEELLRTLEYTPVEGNSAVDYAHHHHLPPFYKSGAIPIELHRTIEAAANPFAIDTAGLWERAQPAKIAGVEVRVLSPEDLLLHLCVHAAYNHRFEVPLLSLMDIAEVARHHRSELDWRRLVSVAEQSGAGRFVYCLLSVVRQLLGAEIPQATLAAIRHTPDDDAMIHTVREYLLLPPEDLPVAYARFGENKGFAARFRLLLRSLFPTRETMVRIYAVPEGSRSLYGYYLLRPLDLLRRRGRIMLEIVVRARRIRPALEREKRRQRIHRWVEEAP
jgi:hypothetical protein